MLVRLAAEAVAVLLGRSCKSWPDGGLPKAQLGKPWLLLARSPS